MILPFYPTYDMPILWIFLVKLGMEWQNSVFYIIYTPRIVFYCRQEPIFPPRIGFYRTEQEKAFPGVIKEVPDYTCTLS